MIQSNLNQSNACFKYCQHRMGHIFIVCDDSDDRTKS